MTRYFPLARGYFIASPFGPRAGGFHAGTDFGWPGGSGGLPIYACQSGTVIHAGAASGYGGPDPAGWLVIDSNDAEGGGCAEYGHLIREVGAGEHVQEGQRIAHINPDSNANGGVPPHCHLSIMPGGYDPTTKLDPLPWLGQAAYPAEQQQPTGGTVAPGLPNNQQIIDCAAPLSVQDVANRGYAGRAWYLDRPGGASWIQHVTRADVDESARLGQAMMVNAEMGTGDWMLQPWIPGVNAGWDTGVAAGLWIRDRHGELGNPCPVIPLSADAHFSPGQLDVVVACAKGVQSVIGSVGRGVYGFWETMDRFHAEGIADVYWQCGAQSDLRPWVQLYQRNNDGDTIAGHAVDCNDIIQPNYGQIGTGASAAPAVAPAPPPPPPPMVGGAIGDLYNALGGPGGFLGNPTTFETGCPDGIGRYNHFDLGSVYYTPTTGAHEVHGVIHDGWAGQGWETGKWGYPISNEIGCSEGVHQYFQGAALFYRTYDNSITELK